MQMISGVVVDLTHGALLSLGAKEVDRHHFVVRERAVESAVVVAQTQRVGSSTALEVVAHVEVEANQAIFPSGAIFLGGLPSRKLSVHVGPGGG